MTKTLENVEFYEAKKKKSSNYSDLRFALLIWTTQWLHEVVFEDIILER